MREGSAFTPAHLLSSDGRTSFLLDTGRSLHGCTEPIAKHGTDTPMHAKSVFYCFKFNNKLVLKSLLMHLIKVSKVPPQNRQ